MKAIAAAILGVLVSSTAYAQYDHSGDLDWTWDGSFKPPVQSGNGDFPSQRQANIAFERARDGDPVMTIDFHQVAPGKPLPAAIFLFACKNGGYDAYRHKVDQDPQFVHCQTFFMDESRRKLYGRPVNFMRKDRENWGIVLPTRPRELPIAEKGSSYFPPVPSGGIPPR